jgi:hypothetical protein
MKLQQMILFSQPGRYRQRASGLEEGRPEEGERGGQQEPETHFRSRPARTIPTSPRRNGRSLRRRPVPPQ